MFRPLKARYAVALAGALWQALVRQLKISLRAYCMEPQAMASKAAV